MSILMTSLLSRRPSTTALVSRQSATPPQSRRRKKKQPSSAATVDQSPGGSPPASPPAPSQWALPQPLPEGFRMDVMPTSSDMDIIRTFMSNFDIVPGATDEDQLSAGWADEARDKVEVICQSVMTDCACPPSPASTSTPDVTCASCKMCTDLHQLDLPSLCAGRKTAKNTRLGLLLAVAPIVARFHQAISSTVQREKVSPCCTYAQKCCQQKHYITQNTLNNCYMFHCCIILSSNDIC